MYRSRSKDIFDRLKKVIPGGVNSAARAFPDVPIDPLIVQRGEGCHLIDADGNCFIDLCMSWGALILGHAHPRIVQAVQAQVERGTSYGLSTEYELRLAEKIVKLLPHVDKVRMVNSGTEATMTAVRLAKGVTGRNRVIKFSGCYHGHADVFLTDHDTWPYGIEHPLPEEAACVIVEPVAGNNGCIIPDRAFLQHLRDECDRTGALLIFDEVITGFRVGLTGASGYFGIQPDLVTLGKIVGGGFPAAAVGGKREYMDALRPVGPVFQAGTLSGNPVAMVAGYETLCEISQPGFYETLEEKTRCATEGLDVIRIGSLFAFQPKIDFESLFMTCFEQGLFIPPSLKELCFVSNAHTDEDIQKINEVLKMNHAVHHPLPCPVP